MRIKAAYLQEVIPEDGCFFTEKSRAWFTISRTTVLDAGSLSEKYGFESKIKPHLKEFIRSIGRKVSYGKDGSYRRYELLGGELRRLTEQKEDSLICQQARQLRDVIRENPCQLLDDEIELAKNMGIRMTRRVRQINLFDSGRVSVNWFAETRRQKDTLSWAILAPPASGRKRLAVDTWFTELVAQGKITLE